MAEVTSSKIKMLCTWGEKCRDQATCSEKFEHVPNICLHFLAGLCPFKSCKKVHATRGTKSNVWQVGEVTFKVNPTVLPKPKLPACPQEEKAPANSCESSAQAPVGSINEDILKSLTLDNSHLKAAFVAFATDDLQPLQDLQATLTAAIEALTVHLNKAKATLRK
jgi:hypothetical protein